MTKIWDFFLIVKVVVQTFDKINWGGGGVVLTFDKKF